MDLFVGMVPGVIVGGCVVSVVGAVRWRTGASPCGAVPKAVGLMARLWMCAVACVLIGAGAAGLSGCAHATRDARETTQRRLRVLERDFSAFIAERPRSMGDVERAVASLETLRLHYLDALAQTVDPRERIVCLVRIAELHLDLGARIRRVPYPSGPATGTRAAQQAFDAALSQHALPLEAVGHGVLMQVLVEARMRGIETRMTHRAGLYVALHSGERLGSQELACLARELVDRSWAAPRTLLETGRIGQRAARP